MFSIVEAIRTGWCVFKENAGFLIGAHLIAILVQTVPQLLFRDSPGMQAIVVIPSLLCSFVVALGLVRVGLDLVDGHSGSYEDLFSQAHLVFGYLIASILHTLVSFLGILLLIVPGIVWYAQFSLWPYLMVEHGMGPIEAMKESSRITRGHRGQLILFYLALALVAIVGLAAFVVGIVPALGVITVSTAFVYRRLNDSPPETAVVS